MSGSLRSSPGLLWRFMLVKCSLVRPGCMMHTRLHGNDHIGSSVVMTSIPLPQVNGLPSSPVGQTRNVDDASRMHRCGMADLHVVGRKATFCTIGWPYFQALTLGSNDIITIITMNVGRWWMPMSHRLLMLEGVVIIAANFIRVQLSSLHSPPANFSKAFRQAST